MSDPHDFLQQLEDIIDRRIAERPAGSYVTRLLDAGPRKVAQKVGEEGVELALAAAAGDRAEAVTEAADLLFHALLALRTLGVPLTEVCAELQRRHAERPGT